MISTREKVAEERWHKAGTSAINLNQKEKLGTD